MENTKAIKVLEYNKIISMLSREAASQITRELIEKSLPLVDEYRVKELLAETAEAVSVVVHKGALPLGNFYDNRGAINLAAKGGTLTMKQLLQVLYNMRIAREVSEFLSEDVPEVHIIKEMSNLLAVHRRLEDNIDRCILSEDEMSDNASPELKQIRRSIIRQNDAIRAKLSHMVASESGKSLLQDAIVTMRQGRYVLPVKAEHRSRVPGIIHDQSGTGATIFVEPQAIVNMNNELRELELAEEKEIQRILAELSSAVAEHRKELLNNQELLVKLDYIFARGRLSVAIGGTEVEINHRGIVDIKKGRHPLLNPEKVVPIDVYLGDRYRTLVITGPNTGGKTVTLKTVGLLAMMNQSGIQIPASAGSSICIFENIYADIGDEQSIEQSLSTFSSHMNNIVNIVESAGEKSLVLVDELGAGTDPTEGAALAISILEELYRRGCTTIATTHYTELKKYAIEREGVENASMEFDVETLSPTYRLTIGIPGKSNAFEISRKLGLSEEIIDRAGEFLKQEDVEFEKLLSSIEADRKQAQEDREKAASMREEIKEAEDQIKRKLSELAEKKEKILAAARAEARDILAEARDVAEDTQKKLREIDKMDSMAERHARLLESKRRIKETGNKYRETIKVPENYKPVTVDQLTVGEKVKVMTLGQNGEILTLPDSKGDMQVQIGLIKANVNLKDLMLLREGKAKKVGKTGAPASKSGKAKYGNLYKSKAMNVSLSINVRGQNLDDAIMNVDKYLDDAYMAGLEEVTIIHGRGEGILRTGLQAMFKKHKHVDSFRKGAFNEGGDGVTVVRLK